MPIVVKDETIFTRTGTRDIVTRLVIAKAVVIIVTLNCGETQTSITKCNVNHRQILGVFPTLHVEKLHVALVTSSRPKFKIINSLYNNQKSKQVIIVGVHVYKLLHEKRITFFIDRSDINLFQSISYNESLRKTILDSK